MKRILLVAALLPLVFARATAEEGKKEPEKPSYFKTLVSLCAPLDAPVKANPRASGLSKVVLFEKAAGVAFGASMDDAVAVWGRPKLLRQLESYPGPHRVTKLIYGGLTLAFRKNSLFEMQIQPAAVPKLYFSEGITFDWSKEKIVGAWGEPVRRESRGSTLVYERKGGMVRFHFYAPSGKAPRLISVWLTRADKDGK